MSQLFSRLLSKLKIRWKMLIVILPLVIVPIVLLGAIIGYVATRQAYEGLSEASRADLDHMASFTLDLLDSHHRQFEVYRQDKKKIVEQEMKSLVNLAFAMLNEQQRHHRDGRIDLETAKQTVRNSFKDVSIGSSGYLFAMTGAAVLTVHPAREGENISAVQDEDGRYFIREMTERALAAPPGEVLYTIYPWYNELLGDKRPRNKIVAFRYCPTWDWIIAAGGYLDETYDDPEFERNALATLGQQIKSKKVGQTGYIFCMSGSGLMTIHPDAEGENLLGAEDATGRAFIAEMVAQKDGWIRYPWRGANDRQARMKIVRYRYFKPWDWVVAVG
ncbi:MAG: cache domain-containing protein, partial [Pelovirga sp.]